MKRKILNTLMVAMLLVSMPIVFFNVASAATWGQLYLDPSEVKYYDQADLTGTEFTVTMKVTNVTNWCGFGVYVYYNTSILDATNVSVVLAGVSNLAPLDPVTYEWIPINDTLGQVMFGFTNTLPGKTGSFDIATIRFQITAAPPLATYPYEKNETLSSVLNVTGASIVDNLSQEQIQNYEVLDGYYEYTRPQIVAGAPTAIFTWSPTFPYISDTVTVDGSSSLSGDSTIISWDWTLTGPATWTSANGAPTRQFHCDGVGDVTVTLNITNTLPLWDTVTHVITQKEMLGAAIDVWTQNWRQYPEWTYTPYNGTGEFMDADSYAPGENVSLWALVTYNGELVQNILVGFEVLDPNGDCVTYRVDPTDDIGIAQVNFRIPIPCDPAEQEDLFGHYTVIAKAKVQDDIINDTMHFKVGFIVEVLDVTPLDLPLVKGTTACFDVTLKNIAWVPRNVTVIVVVYDECDVPIGQVILEFNMPAAPAQLCSSINVTKTLCIPVPKWAYVGIGAVYANAFTHLPQDCGVPYCPEASEVIEIVA